MTLCDIVLLSITKTVVISMHVPCTMYNILYSGNTDTQYTQKKHTHSCVIIILLYYGTLSQLKEVKTIIKTINYYTLIMITHTEYSILMLILYLYVLCYYITCCFV